MNIRKADKFTKLVATIESNCFNQKTVYVDINYKDLVVFKVFRTSGLLKEISSNSVSTRKLNGYTGDLNPQPLDCRSIALPLELI